MPTLGTATQTNTAQSAILDKVDNLVPLLPTMSNIIEAWVDGLTPAATTATVISALQGPLTESTAILDRLKDHVRTRKGIDLNVTPFGSLTDTQRKQVLDATDAFLGVLLNLALFAKLRADDEA